MSITVGNESRIVMSRSPESQTTTTSPAIPGGSTGNAFSMNITKMNLHGLAYASVQCLSPDEQSESR